MVCVRLTVARRRRIFTVFPCKELAGWSAQRPAAQSGMGRRGAAGFVAAQPVSAALDPHTNCRAYDTRRPPRAVFKSTLRRSISPALYSVSFPENVTFGVPRAV